MRTLPIAPLALGVLAAISGCSFPAAEKPAVTRNEAVSPASVTAATSAKQESSSSASTKKAKSPTLDELLLFFPTKYPHGNWKPEGLDFEDVWFHAEDGTRLHA